MQRHFLLLLFVHAYLSGVLVAGEDGPIKLEPAAPKVDEPFEVILVTDAAAAPAGVQYDWFVNVKSTEMKDDKSPEMKLELTDAGVPVPAPNSARLPIAKARGNTTYRFTLSRIQHNIEQVLPAFVVSFDDTMLVSATLAHSGPPPAAPSEIVASFASSDLPRDPSPNESVGQKLRLAQLWEEGIAAAPKSDSLVLPVEFFQLWLIKPRENNISLQIRSQTPNLDAELLYRAMQAAAGRVPADSSSHQAVAVWLAEKPRFLASMNSYGQTDKTKLAWSEFVDDWLRQVLRLRSSTSSSLLN